MRISLTIPRLAGVCLALVALSILLAVPVSAQNKRETTLNEVTLNFTAPQVIDKRGMPHYIGPALPGADAIEKILNPPPELPTMGASGGPMAPAGPGMPDPSAVAGPPKPKPEDEYIVWMYEGNSKDGTASLGEGFSTYVIFDKFGKVVGVTVAWDKADGFPPPIFSTRRGANGEKVGFGTRLIDMVKLYDWPDPFVRLDKYYFCAYPDANIAFSLDTGTRKVMVMSVGMLVTVLKSEGKSDSSSGGPLLSGPGALPGPGGAVMPR